MNCEQTGSIIAISISKNKGEKKQNIPFACLKENFGIVGDAHSGDWHRQISLLAQESINKIIEKGLQVKPGDFAENITTEWINLKDLLIGTKIQIGENILLEVTQIGKVCHSHCAIYYAVGDCVMPKEGIFAKVLQGGEIKTGDKISVL
ncbi:MAG: MOSC domain-containing protein [Candidatus Firestonebacteria bacterium]